MTELDPQWYFDHVLDHATPGDYAGVIAPDSTAVWQAWWRERARADPDAARQGFVRTTAQLRAAGIDSNAVRRAVRRGTWTRPVRGVVVTVDVGSGDDGGTHARRPGPA